jgi:hypothetical protein
MTTVADIREELAADRIRIARIISDSEALQERYRILTEDPVNNAAGLRQLQQDINTFRAQGNEILASFDVLATMISALPAGPEKTALVEESNSIIRPFNSFNANTFRPFKQTVDAEVARVDQELAVAAADFTQAPAPVPNNVTATQDAEGTPPNNWGIWNNDTGTWIERGLTQQQALLREQDLQAATEPEALQTSELEEFDVSDPPQTPSAEQAAAVEAARERARVQAVLANQIRQADSGDWRFKIRLAPGARYLYRGDDGQGVQSGILAPLAVTDGVIFPYTPSVTTAYRARYAEQDLPHSNYRGYFYSGSNVEMVNVQATFTAQDTAEANYLLAVIHFFRSVTKMFYGQNDSYRGAPPPLVFLQGFGAYQFSRHPCVVTNFNYVLPSDVDYIRADVQPITGLNIQQGRNPGGVPPQSLPTNVFTGAMARLANAGASKGAIFRPPAVENLGTNAPTYVPTKLDMTLELLPMQTRQQVSQEFSMRDFANGSLLRKGFW